MLTELFDGCDLAIQTEYKENPNVIGYFAKAKARAVLEQLSGDFTPIAWLPASDGSDWAAVALRPVSGEVPREVANRVAWHALEHGCNVMMSRNGGAFEPIYLGETESFRNDATRH